MDSVTTVATVLIRAGGGGTAVFLVYGLVDLPCVRLFPGHAGGDCPGHGGEAGGGDQASSLH